MEKSARRKILYSIKASHQSYLAEIAGSKHVEALRPRFRNLTRKIPKLLRKQEGSASSLKDIPTLARLVFGLEEDLPRLGLPGFEFCREKKVINRYVIAALDQRRATQYSGECDSYGETLLNCYLDLFITLTVMKTPREIGAKPGFLVNPSTGAVLEIDVMLEGFRLGFEFQGEHHYTDPKVQVKDSFKLAALARHKRILIPVNIVQLHGKTLQSLIANSIKDHLGLQDLLKSRNPRKLQAGTVSNKQLLQFSKATQRIFLSKLLFGPSLAWLDSEANRYITNMKHRCPISSSTPAPRHIPPTGDLDVTYIYRNLKYVTEARKRDIS